MMKKFTFLLFAMLAFNLGFSQSDCANALALTPGTPQAGETTTGVGSFSDTNVAPEVNPCSASYNDLEYWFQYTAVTTGETLDISVTDITSNWYGVFIIDNCPDSAPTCVAQDTNGASNADLAVTTPSLTAGTTYYIVMTDYIEGPTTFTMNSTVIAPPTCLAATNLNATPLEGNVTADVSWDVEAGATSGYNWAVLTAGEDPAVDTPVSSGSTAAGVTMDTATGLTSASSYDLYVQSNCDANGLSTWAGPFNFVSIVAPPNDECAGAIALTVNDDYACGTVTSATTLGATASPQPDDATGTPNNDVWFTFMATATDHKIELSNVVNQGGGTSTSTDMGMSVFDDLAGCNMVAANEVGESDPNTLDLTGLTIGNTYYVRAYGWFTTIQNNNFDVCVGTAPSCPAPTTQTATDITTTTANLGWTTGGTAAWEIVVQADGTGEPTVDGTATSDNPYAATGLTQDTAYEFYVRDVCAADDKSAWTGPFAFSTPPPPPANDACAGAIALTVGTNFSSNTVDATNVASTASGELPAPSCGGTIGEDVWFSVVVPASGNIAIEARANGGITDGVMSVYSGMCGSLVEVECDDDDGLGTMPKLALSGQTVGETLLVRFWEWGTNAEGTFQMAAYEAVANDECVGAEALTLGTTAQGDNSNATKSADATPSCNNISDRADVWYSFNSDTFDSLDIICQSGYFMQVWEGACGSLTHLASSCGEQVLENLAVTAGSDYFIQVWSLAEATRATGAFEITVQDAAAGIADNVIDGFNMYPNPVTSTLNLNAQKQIDAVSIYNMLGQEVLRNTPSATQVQMDMSSLPTGAYIVKVQAGTQVGSYNLIKQ